ncbi:MAG TPA: hypothetical protein VE378_00260 [Nitrososphaeraceae archaeon]|nr:hypothetical protein [Nitrososphaeraceae archaeon]
MSNTEENTSTAKTSRLSSLKHMTPEQTADAIKNVAKNLRESSYKMREAVRAIRKSGAIDELTEAVREATLAARDTVKEVNDVAKEMKERGVIQETIVAAEDLNATARETAQAVKETVARKSRAEPGTSNVTERATTRSRTKESSTL